MTSFLLRSNDRMDLHRQLHKAVDGTSLRGVTLGDVDALYCALVYDTAEVGRELVASGDGQDDDRKEIAFLILDALAGEEAQDEAALSLWANELSEWGFDLPELLDEWDARWTKEKLESAVDGLGHSGTGRKM